MAPLAAFPGELLSPASATAVSAVTASTLTRAFEARDPPAWLTKRIMVAAGACSALGLLYAFGSRRAKQRAAAVVGSNNDSKISVVSTASGLEKASLLKTHANIVSYKTAGRTYPGIRAVYSLHKKASLLPPRLPLLVFIHGIGGQLAQFQHLLDFFVNISHVLAIDLPGCGGSEFLPKDWDAYTTEALASLIAAVVDQHLSGADRVVLIGHSALGCRLAATLATEGGYLSEKCVGLVAICPKAEFSEQERKKHERAGGWGCLTNLCRKYKTWGGMYSNAVNRMVGQNATPEARAAQKWFNDESQTAVWRRMMKGLSLPGRTEWTAITCPIMIIGAAEDRFTPPEDAQCIYSWICNSSESHESAASEQSASTSSKSEDTRPVETRIIPSAGHNVMFENYAVLNNAIGGFLREHVEECLDLGWQLLHLKEDKWMLKNFEKWRSTQSVSPRISARPRPWFSGLVATPFRPMKTLRQDDTNGHNPRDFSRMYPDVADVIDLSHEQPPYDPTTFDNVKYHKYSIVSKIPPTRDEVAGFIELVDQIRVERGHDESRTIACHCHYGFNRTGFFVCCYLIERMNFGVEEAVEAFKAARSPGIKHPHFLTELSDRYK